MNIIVGLGNPGEEYKLTRHNVGFIILDHIASKNGLIFEVVSKFDALIVKSLGGTKETVYIKPQSFMNKSGEVVSKYLSFFKISSENLTVIHDDVDLEFGRVKVQIGAGAAGHHGVEDIIAKTGTSNFKRIRVGIGRPDNKNISISDWVLQPFTQTELLELEKTAEEVAKLVI